MGPPRGRAAVAVRQAGRRTMCEKCDVARAGAPRLQQRARRCAYGRVAHDSGARNHCSAKEQPGRRQNRRHGLPGRQGDPALFCSLAQTACILALLAKRTRGNQTSLYDSSEIYRLTPSCTLTRASSFSICLTVQYSTVLYFTRRRGMRGERVSSCDLGFWHGYSTRPPRDSSQLMIVT